MKKRVLKDVGVCLAVSIMLTGLSGCGLLKKDTVEEGPTYEELQDMVSSYANDVGTLNEQIDALQASLDKATGKTGTKAGDIVDLDVGGGKTFNPLNGTITLPEEFVYPGSSECPASSKVMLESRVGVEPTSNWTIVVNRTTIDMVHTSGITAKFHVTGATGRLNYDELKEQLFEPLVNQIPVTEINYSSIFYSGQVAGIQANISTSVNNGDAQMRLGAFSLSDRNVTYATLYEGATSPEKEETVSKLLATVSFGSSYIEFS